LPLMFGLYQFQNSDEQLKYVNIYIKIK
jgi:hypothetical protein